MGFPPTKQLTMSVPPEMDARWRSCLMCSYTKSKLSGASGDPVDVIVRTDANECDSRGRAPAFETASMNRAEVPKSVISVSSANVKSVCGSGWNGEPSYRRIVPPHASTVTSQFHIIQPSVVK